MTKAIVIAGGQSVYDENIIEKIKDKPDLTILSTDRTLKYCLENNVVPEYCCIQENLITAEGVDNLKLFFFHGIVKSHAHEITLYHSQILTKERQQIVKDMGFKTIIFNRFGCGGNLPNIINTSGNCGMALVEIARKLLKIDKIAVIPSLTSSPLKEIFSFFFVLSMLFVLAYLFRVLVRAVLKPAKCVPPSIVFMLFTKVSMLEEYVSL